MVCSSKDIRGRVRIFRVCSCPSYFWPLLSPRWLGACSSTFAIALLSRFATTVELYSHYLTPAVPVLIGGAVISLGKLEKMKRPVTTMAWLACFVGYFVWGGGPGSQGFRVQDFVTEENSLLRHRLLSTIDSGASIQAPDALLPHLAERKELHRTPPDEVEFGADIVILDVSHRQRFPQRMWSQTIERITRSTMVRAQRVSIDGQLGALDDV